MDPTRINSPPGPSAPAERSSTEEAVVKPPQGATPPTAAQLATWEQVRLRILAGFRRFPPPMTTALVAGIILIHLAVGLDDLTSRAPGLFQAFLGSRTTLLLTTWGARSGGLVLSGEYWRLFSALLLHGDGLHLALNAVALFGLGRLCEAIYGPVRLAWLFLWSGLAGSLLSQIGNPGSISVGASGAVFGLMGAGVVFGWRYRHALPPPLRQVFWRGLMPWILLNLFIGFSMRHVIDNHGHIGGLVGGAILAASLGSPVIPGAEGRPRARVFMAFLSAAVLGWTLAQMLLNRWA